MAVSRAVVLLLVILTGAAAFSPTDSTPEDADTKPSILTPIAHSPLGSFEGADGPVADNAIDDDDAAPVGSPIGTTMTEPEPQLAPPGLPDSSATAASVGHPVAAAAVAAAMATASAIFAL
ncbi:hypothetical protein Zm00014a_030758 [Zea mays]|jgi:hypothetical protein|uniref:Uncharacterized protein n=4 Tax=Zea mays TaxID=4577 RepID=A0A1D6EKL2_MAIZE|nr:hypothetical protein ZEAMMB73_Zm00001d005145 [Zea mays]PWZ37323.1 hypothetical protein Zm00014a_030758 [Zea mays]